MIESLSRPADGRIMCCICFEYFTIEELAIDGAGRRTDLCVDCWADELIDIGFVGPFFEVVKSDDAEPLYDLDKKKWNKTCPCIRAEQRDPECPWHGREAP